VTRKVLVLSAVLEMMIPRFVWAGEETFQLKPGAGKDRVVRNCIICHSLDYIAMNAKVMDRKGWQTVINKMIQVMGAPVPPAHVPEILEYLSTHYSKSPPKLPPP
jgi:hypothetical protein